MNNKTQVIVLTLVVTVCLTLTVASFIFAKFPEGDEDKDRLTLREEMEYGSDPTKPNPTLAYAVKDMGLPKDISTRLIGLDKDGQKELDLDNKVLVDCLYNLTNLEVVPRDIKELVPKVYGESVVRALQTKVLDNILADGKVSTEEGRALAYLSSFNSSVQRERIEHGLDEASIKQLAILSQHPDQQFARYAVEQKLGVEDYLLNQDELNLLANPSAENMAKVREQYLKLLNDTSDPTYIELVKEWKKLPEFKNDLPTVETTEDMVFLALSGKPYAKFEDRFNSTKITPEHEVHEAFELMLKGGTPDPSDFKYQVPAWNTELEVLRWLAEQNEFKKHDTLAQAIAMNHGLIRTMGDTQVADSLYNYANDLLNFFRETNEIQKSREYYQLEDYPLEAKIALAWTGSENVGYKLIHLNDQGKHIDKNTYSQSSASLSTLREMRNFVINQWLDRDADKIIKKMENLYIDLPKYWAGQTPTWTVGEEKDRVLLNANYTWEYFKAHGKGIGVCVDETTFDDALAKSVGIATLPIEVGGTRKDNSKLEAHAFVLYYNSESKIWKSFKDQVMVPSSAYKSPYWIDVYLPPVQQSGLLQFYQTPTDFPMFITAGYRPTLVGINNIEFLTGGITTDKLKNDVILPFYQNRKYVILWA